MVVVTHADAYLCLLQNAAQVLQHKEHGWTTCGALRAGESTAVSRSFLHVVRQDLRTPSARPALITHKLPITMQARPRLCQRTHGLTVQASVISPSRFNQNWNCYDVMIISPTSPLPLIGTSDWPRLAKACKISLYRIDLYIAWIFGPSEEGSRRQKRRESIARYRCTQIQEATLHLESQQQGIVEPVIIVVTTIKRLPHNTISPYL